jgi:Leucine-rich repeat (LRR) protein
MKYNKITSLGRLGLYMILIAGFFQTAVAQKKNKEPLENGSFNSLEEALSADPATVYKLNLSKKKIKEFPADIFRFSNLQQLDLSNNKLIALPENISDLKNLSYLNISKNKLTALPQNLGMLRNLNSFKMSQNKISELPSSFFKLTKLEIIDFYSNPLSFDPNQFNAMKGKIKFIDVRNTSLSKENCMLLKELLADAVIKFDKGCDCHK